MLNKFQNILLTITEVGMLLYWLFAAVVAMDLIYVDPSMMYSDYQNPLIVSWNWSFFPIDVMFAFIGLVGRYSKLSKTKRSVLSVISLSLMFCAGLMAVSFWVIQGSFDIFWWAINIWLMVLAGYFLVQKLSDKE